MPEFKHRYPVRCPECGLDLTAEDSVLVECSILDQIVSFSSKLDERGWLIDKDNVVTNGYHSNTTCSHCDEALDDHECS